MPIVRKRLTPSEVYPADIRYNPSGDKIERLVDGEWKDAPESDPRKATTLPPRITADSRCDGAKSVSDALKNQINQIAEAIDNTQTVFQIAGLILGLFSFGVFAVFINIALAVANYMIDLGTATIETALPPSAYDTLTCILYCYMNDKGQISADDLPNVYQELVDQLGGTGGQILIEMLQLAGAGGINGLSAIGQSTGDCDECGCATTWCKYFDFSVAEWNWQAIRLGTGAIFGVITAGQFDGTNAVDTISSPDIAHHGIVLQRVFAGRVVTKIRVGYDVTKSANIDQATGSAFRITNGDIFTGGVLMNIAFNALANGTNLVREWTGSQFMEEVQLWLFASRDQTSPYSYGGLTHIKYVLMEGEGSNPFGADDCP